VSFRVAARVCERRSPATSEEGPPYSVAISSARNSGWSCSACLRHRPREVR
jgi:hypothetical protein